VSPIVTEARRPASRIASRLCAKTQSAMEAGSARPLERSRADSTGEATLPGSAPAAR